MLLLQSDDGLDKEVQKGKVWNWRHDLYAIVKNVAGLRKLCQVHQNGQFIPSTASIGQCLFHFAIIYELLIFI
jgi:hypothetical protein